MTELARQRTNELGQPIGREVRDWQPPPRPAREELEGRYCRLAPLDLDQHAHALFEAYAADQEERVWTYLGYGPFSSFDQYRDWLVANCLGDDPMFFAIQELESERWVGVASYLRIEPGLGSLEVGHICYGPALQRSCAGTEAMYLMMRHAFELGYRRYEWKCDALNAGSRRAALRYGFRFEGVFRQALVYKGRNRDTAWFAVSDHEWPRVRSGFERWLAADNFGPDRRQISPLRTTLEREPPSAPGLRFRLARREDLPQIVGLLADDQLGAHRELPESPLPASYLDAFDEIDLDPNNELALALDGEQVVGLAQITYTRYLSHRGGLRATLEGVRVQTERRGSGIGSKLMQWAIDRARDRRCHLVQLTTNLSRTDARRFYERLGFVVTHAGMKLNVAEGDTSS